MEQHIESFGPQNLNETISWLWWEVKYSLIYNKRRILIYYLLEMEIFTIKTNPWFCSWSQLEMCSWSIMEVYIFDITKDFGCKDFYCVFKKCFYNFIGIWDILISFFKNCWQKIPVLLLTSEVILISWNLATQQKMLSFTISIINHWTRRILFQLLILNYICIVIDICRFQAVKGHLLFWFKQSEVFKVISL